MISLCACIRRPVLLFFFFLSKFPSALFFPSLRALTKVKRLQIDVLVVHAYAKRSFQQKTARLACPSCAKIYLAFRYAS